MEDIPRREFVKRGAATLAWTAPAVSTLALPDFSEVGTPYQCCRENFLQIALLDPVEVEPDRYRIQLAITAQCPQIPDPCPNPPCTGCPLHLDVRFIVIPHAVVVEIGPDFVEVVIKRYPATFRVDAIAKLTCGGHRCRRARESQRFTIP